MKNIHLQSIEIQNFKGCKSASYSFQTNTWIYGANGTGKTTIPDSFLWCLFGKNSGDKKDFSIKPLDQDNKTTDKTDNEVSVTLLVDNSTIVLKRVNRENWVRSRGELEAKFTGNETLFYYNGVPQKAKEYSDKVNEILNEGLFKMITSPFYFAGLPWQERRQLIISIVGEVNDKDIALTRKEFQELFDRLAGKPFDDFKKEIASQKKGYKTELDQIPARIDELNRSMPEMPDVDLIKIDINKSEMAIQQCNDRIKDKSKASEQFFAEKSLRNKRIYEIQSQLSTLAETEKNKIRDSFSSISNQRFELQSAHTTIERELSENKKVIDTLNATLKSIDQEIVKLRQQWMSENESIITFSETEFTCPTCKRPYDTEDVEARQADMTANFNAVKAERLSSINQQGKQKADVKKEISAKIEELQESITLQSEILELKSKELKELPEVVSEYDINIQANKAVIESREYVELDEELKRLKEVNDLPFSESAEFSNIEAERAKEQANLDVLKKRLNDVEVINRTKARIDELTERSKQLSQLISNLEKQEFTMAEFEKTKVDIIEDKVNELFSRVKFKMFRQQINGGLEPCCDILINGVPFSDANTAGQINAGLEIIQILCQHYKVSAPIFIDNRESVSEIIPIESQIINLVVSPEHKTLTFK